MRWWKILSVVFGFCFSCFALAQNGLNNVQPGSLAFQTYGVEHGLGNQTVYDVIQDNQGYIWAATDFGVYRYDGNHFRGYTIKEGLPHTSVEHFFLASDGTLFAHTSKGPAAFKDGQFHAILGAPQEPSHGGVNVPGGKHWLLTQIGPLERKSWNEYQVVPNAPKGSATAGAMEPQGEGSWIATWDGTTAQLSRWDGKTFYHFPVAGSIEQAVGAMAVDKAGRVWARTLNELWVLTPGDKSFRSIGKILPPTAQYVHIMADTVGALWVATNQGLYRHLNGTWARIGTQEGLPSTSLRGMCQDREGNFWFGGLGLIKLKGRGIWRSVGIPQGLPNDNPWSIIGHSNGHIYVGTDGGLGEGDAQGWRKVAALPNGQIRGLTEGPDGAVYMSGNPAEIIRYDPNNQQVKKWGRSAGFKPKSIVYRILFDAEGHLFAATDGGLFKGTRDGAEWHFEQENIPGTSTDEIFRDLILDQQKRLWVAGQKGLAVREKGVWKRFGTESGLQRPYVTYLASRLDGTMVVGYWDPVGLTQFTYLDSQLKNIKQWNTDTIPGFPPGKIYVLKEDLRGNFWLGLGIGIAVMRPNGQIELFNKSHGLPGEDINSQSFLALPSGDIWMGVGSGVAHFDASWDQGPLQAPDSAVQLLAFGDRIFLDPQKELTITPGDTSLDAEVAAFSYYDEESVEIQLRLIGVEETWRKAKSRLQHYPALSPGHYTLEVRSRIAQQAWGPVASSSFTILPSWWQTWWFRLFILMLGILSIYGVVWWRINTLRKNNQILEALVAERTQALSVANQALHNQSVTDPLTGLHNRRYLDLCIAEDVAQVFRAHQTLINHEERFSCNIDMVFLMVDLDHFKIVNDQYGHAAGDRVLQQVATILSDAVRDTDTVVRWGGEEFLVVARNASRGEATVIAERIRTKIETHVFDLGDNRTLRRTCSAGFCVYPFHQGAKQVLGWERVVELADRCLYAAKRSGRNAWVGLLISDNLDFETLSSDVNLHLEDYIAKGFVVPHSSLAKETVLDWSQKNA